MHFVLQCWILWTAFNYSAMANSCKIFFFYSLSDPFLKYLQRLFDIDPLLPRLIVNKANVENLSQLFGRVPVSVLIMRLIQECAFNLKVSVCLLKMLSEMCTQVL